MPGFSTTTVDGYFQALIGKKVTWVVRNSWHKVRERRQAQDASPTTVIRRGYAGTYARCGAGDPCFGLLNDLCSTMQRPMDSTADQAKPFPECCFNGLGPVNWTGGASYRFSFLNFQSSKTLLCGQAPTVGPERYAWWLKTSVSAWNY